MSAKPVQVPLPPRLSLRQLLVVRPLPRAAQSPHLLPSLQTVLAVLLVDTLVLDPNSASAAANMGTAEALMPTVEPTACLDMVNAALYRLRHPAPVPAQAAAASRPGAPSRLAALRLDRSQLAALRPGHFQPAALRPDRSRLAVPLRQGQSQPVALRRAGRFRLVVLLRLADPSQRAACSRLRPAGPTLPAALLHRGPS